MTLSDVSCDESHDGPVVGEEQRHHEVGDGGLGQAGDQAQPPRGPAVTQDDLDHGGEAAGGHRDPGVVPDLPHARVHGVNLVFVELGRQRGEVEEPVPEAADGEGRHHVPQEDVGNPVYPPFLGGNYSRTFKQLQLH